MFLFSEKSFGKDGDSYLPFQCRKSYQCTAAAELGAIIRAKNSNSCPKDQKLSKLCSDPGLKFVERGQYFCTLDTEEGQVMQHLCREYTMPRNEKGTRIRGWIFRNTRIGPVLDIKVCYHDDRYSIEVQIPSLYEDNVASWVRIVNGVDKYVTESLLKKGEEDIASGNSLAKARPRQNPTVTLTSVSILVLER